MREHLSKIVVVALLVIVVGVPFALQPSTPADEVSDASARRLIVYTPHNEQTRYEFGRAFNEWRRANDEPAVRFDWRAMGGTSDLRKIVLSQLEAKAQAGREDEGIGADLFFGGGDYEHNQLADGVIVERDGKDVQIPATVRIDFPEGMLGRIYPSPTIGGERLYHPDRRWVGAAVSSFGIIYNRDVLAMRALDTPRSWVDLQTPAYKGWIALADPAHSGSISATYNTILRRHGWRKGWRLMRRVFANARYFTSSSAQVPVDVSAGEAAAGMCIDFYGRFQSGAIVGNRVGYVDPRHMTATTADPIAILRGAPHRALASQFVLWLLSRDAQALWQREVGAPNGPEKYELRRQPVRRDMYNRPDEQQHWTDPQVNPFATAKPMPDAVPSYYPMVEPVSHALAIDIHQELVAAWSAIQRTPKGSAKRQKMLELFDAMPEDLQVGWPDDALADNWHDAITNASHPRHREAVRVLEAFESRLVRDYYADQVHLDDARLEWTRFFRRNYQRIAQMAP